MGLFDSFRKKTTSLENFSQKTHKGFFAKIGSLFDGSYRLDENIFENLQELLILSDVGVKTSEKICEKLKENVKKEKLADSEAIKNSLKQVLIEILDKNQKVELASKPQLILVTGVNGVGKTTTIGKLANYFARQDKKVLLGAADTFRAGAIEQLNLWAEKTNVPIVKQNEGSDPASVVFDSISAAKARGIDVLICDTAGRLHNKQGLMDELSKIKRVANRELEDAKIETLLVIDATTGQNGVVQAKQFKEVVDVTGVALTKLDGTAKGGIVFAIKEELGIPIKFIGVGENIEDLKEFDAVSFVEDIFNES